MTILVMKELAIRCFQQSLDLLEKPSSNRAIGDAVISGETHGHDRTHSNAFAVRHDARPDLADRQDSALRRVDDRNKVIDAEHAQIRDRESTTLIVQRKEFFILRFFRKLAALLAQLLQR